MRNVYVFCRRAHVKFTADGIWVDRVVIIPNN